jgi:proteasome accessory factor C
MTTPHSVPDDRLARLLSLVPYFLARPGIAAAEAAADLGVSQTQLRKDLQLLWMCGLGPGELIDGSFDGEHITISYDANLVRPLRLTNREALALLVALRALSASAALADSDAVARALAKIETAAGGSVDSSPVAVSVDAQVRYVALLQQAVTQQRALRLMYYTAARDATTERVVDPVRVVVDGGNSYLQAWCRQAEGFRVFRADRIERAELLDAPARVPADTELPEIVEGLFQPAAEHLLVRMRLAPGYAWVADYYPSESVAAAGEDLLVSLRVAEPAWVHALVLGAGGEVSVLSPGWLAEAITAAAAAALAAYD